MKKHISQRIWFQIVIVLLISGLLAVAASLILNTGNLPSAVWKTSIVVFPGMLILFLAWRFTGAEKGLIWLLSLGLLLRVSVGLISEVSLPLWGYDEPVQNAGYLFYDSYKRDNDAWALAKSDQPIWVAFKNEFVSDQYGGLLSLSAIVYRGLSSDLHRSYLIMILTAFIGMVGVPFIFDASNKRWGRRVAWVAAGMVALFPDAVLFGASQMREPFLISSIALGFWGAIEWGENRKRAAIAILIAGIGLLAISYRVAIPALAVLAGWFVLERIPTTASRKVQLAVWGVIILAGLCMAFLSWEWLQSSSRWDIRETVETSGRVQYVFEGISERFKVPFVVLYGLTQPVLPAAIVDPSLPIWRTIAIYRGLGWYAIAPLLLYGMFAAFKEKKPEVRRLLIWLSISVAIWLLVSSVRAGGDQWDNPRYRSIFLVYISLLCAWGWDYARRMKDPWLGRFYLIEMVFLGFFLEWYISRYYQIIGRLRFEIMLLIIAAISGMIILSGMVWDRIKAKQIPEKSSRR